MWANTLKRRTFVADKQGIYFNDEMMTKRKLLTLAAALTLGVSPACKSKGDTPQVRPDKEQPGKPDQPAKPDQPKPPTDPNKPSDFHIATRMVVKVIDGKEAELLRTLQIEEFAWGGQTDAIKLSDLLPFVTFSSSKPDGTAYTLTAEDLKLLKLVDLKYEEGGLGADNITFKVSYNDVKGTEKLSIPISRRDYFQQKFEVNPAFASQYFLGGVAHLFGVFSGQILRPYDDKKYAVVLSLDQADHHSNSLRVQATVNLPRYKKEDLITLSYDVTGFKPLASLAGNLTFATSSPLNEAMRERLLKLKGGLTDAAILQNLQQNVEGWLKDAQVGVKVEKGLGTLTWQDNGRRLVGNTDGGLDTRDIYLDRVGFVLRKATLSQDRKTLDLVIALVKANEQAIEGVEATLTVRSLNL